MGALLCACEQAQSPRTDRWEPEWPWQVNLLSCRCLGVDDFQWDNLLFFSNSIHLSGREITNSTLFILKTVSKESFISEEMQ